MNDHHQKTKLSRVKVTGNRGNWFATTSDDGRSVPVLWDHQIERRDGEFILETDWQKNGRAKTASKRRLVREYFDTDGPKIKEVIVAQAQDPNLRPHARRRYIRCYSVDVMATQPEIKLRLLSKVFECA